MVFLFRLIGCRLPAELLMGFVSVALCLSHPNGSEPGNQLVPANPSNTSFADASSSANARLLTTSKEQSRVSTSLKIGDSIAKGLSMRKNYTTSRSSPTTPNFYSSIREDSQRGSQYAQAVTSEPTSIANDDGDRTSLAQLQRHGASGVTRLEPWTNKSSTLTSQPIQSDISQRTRYNTTAGYVSNATDCWAQWTSYWARSEAATGSWISVNGSSTTYTTSETIRPLMPSYLTTAVTFTQTSVNNGHPFTTVTSTSSFPTTVEYTWTKGTYVIETETITSVIVPSGSSYVPFKGSVSTPACVLPKVVSQCQAQWDTWATRQLTTFDKPRPNCWVTTTDAWSSLYSYNGLQSCSAGQVWEASFSSFLSAQSSPPPHCGQASLSPSLCNGFRTSYLTSWVSSVAYGLGQIGLPVYTPSMTQVGFLPTQIVGPNGSTITTKYWPSSSTLAPGCTMGCGECAITGNTVQLFYWPVSETQSLNGSTHAKREYKPITAYAFNTSFVSPTVYVYYSGIYASNSCGPVGRTHSSTFVPIANSDEISSIWATIMTSNLIRDQGFGATDDVPSYTARFNFTDLNTPVPASIYDRQPWCVSWLTSKMAYSDSMVLYQSFFASINSTCPQTRPYDPVLVVPLQSIQAIDPLWSNCSFDIRGAFDPPYDLHHASVAAAPTPATQTLSISATPASAPQTSQPAETGSGNVITSVTALLPSASTSPFGASNDPHTSSSLPQGPRSSSVKPGSIRPQPADPSQSPQSTVMGEGSKAGGIIASLLSSSQGSTPGSSPEPVAPVVSSASPGDAETTVPDAGSHAGGGIASIFVGNSAVLSNTLPEAGNTEDSVPNRVSSAASVITSEQQAESGAGIATSSSNEPGTDSAKGGDPINNSPATSYLTIQFSQGEDPTVPSRTELAPSASGVVFTASGSTYTAQATNLADGSSQLIVPLGPSSTILSVSGPAATIGGQVIGAAPDGVIISGSSQGLNLIPASPIVNSGLLSPSDAVFSIGGTPYTAIQTNLAGSSVEVVVPFGSTSATLVQGGPAATIDGQQISAIGNGIIIGSSASSANVAPFTISGSTYTAVQSGAPGRPGEVIIPMSSNSAILSVGGPAATILGQAVSAASNGLAVGSTTVAYEEPVPVQSAAPFTISGTPYTVFETFGPGNQPEAIVPMGSSSITLTPGGAIATINGQTLSAGSDGIVVGSSTARYSANPAHSQVVAPFTISGIPYTALESTLSGQNNEVLVPLGSSTLTLVPGGSATTLGGQILSAAPSGIVVDRTTKPWLQYSDNQPSTEEGTTQLVAPFTLSESPYTAIETNIPGPGNGVIIPLGTTSATLSAGGPATTIDGHAISAASNGIVVDGSTEAFTPSIFTLGTSETIAPFTISGSAYTAFETSIPGLGEEIVIPISGSKITLSPGGSDATVGGEVISAVSTGIVVGGTTKGFRTVAGDGGLFGSSAVAETIAPFQVSGIQYTAFETSVSGEGDEIVIPVGTREITLSPGGPDATIGGEVVSAVDSELVVGGSTDSFVTITGSDIPLATGPTPGYGNGNGDEGGSAASSAGAPAFMKMSWRGKASEPGVWVVAASIACALVG